jgi:L-iditol 2-dehydrogenase
MIGNERREKMKQAVMTAPGEIVFRDIEPPKPGPGEVLLRIQRIGVCGSDMHVYHGKHPYTSYPVVQGHEFSAIVEQVGKGVTNLKPGMKVTSMPQIYCGECAPCRRGDYHICDQLKVQGFQAPGCAQELWVTSADKVVPLPDEFTFEQGAMVEPLAVGVHAVRRAGGLAGKNVVVLGAGPIGNLLAQVAAAEAAKVLITDISEYRLELARKCGIQLTSNPKQESLKDAARRAFGADGFEVAFECVGVEKTIEEAIGNIQKGGTIVVVGVFGEEPRINLGFVQDRELTIKGTLMYQAQDYQRAVELISSGKVILEPLISKVYPFEQYLEAYRFIDQQGDKTMKVFVNVAQS